MKNQSAESVPPVELLSTKQPWREYPAPDTEAVRTLRKWIDRSGFWMRMFFGLLILEEAVLILWLIFYWNPG